MEYKINNQNNKFPLNIAKKLPKIKRRPLGYGWDYISRLIRWISIMREMRGATLRDQLILLASAFASPLISLYKLNQWQDPLLLRDATVRVRGIGVFFLRRCTDDLWHVLPTREQSVLKEIRQGLKPGDIFLDAGANIGIYTVLAGQLVGAAGRVIAVEMMPDTARILREHISKNHLSNVSVIEQALSNVAGQVVVASVPGGQHGQASIAKSVAVGGTEVKVVTTTLSDILGNVERVALMKMDLEGAEQLAIEGEGDVLTRIQTVIFEDWGGSSLSKLFRSKGFAVARLDGNNCIARNLKSK
jgi:FkbM family methyltransferase